MHLFIGPSAAAADTVIGNQSRPSKNHLWNLTKVTPQIISYVHVVVCLHSNVWNSLTNHL